MLWARRLFLVLLLAFGALVLLGAYTGYRLSHPSPDRFHADVQTAGTALQQALGAAPAQAYLADFRFQASPSTCGPTALRNVLTSLGVQVDSERALFGDHRLAWWKALGLGMTLDELARLARANTSYLVDILRIGSLKAFRAVLAEANAPGTRLIVNFDRAPLFGVAVGHFSPIGGYDPTTGLVTLLDVTEGYGFSLVPDALLFRATRTEDPLSGRARGLLRIVDPTLASGGWRPSASGIGFGGALPVHAGQAPWPGRPGMASPVATLPRGPVMQTAWPSRAKDGASGARFHRAVRALRPLT